MNAYETAYERRLRKLLQETIDLKASHIESGMGIDDFAKYREATGYLRALKAVREMMKQVSDDLNREEQTHASDDNEA